MAGKRENDEKRQARRTTAFVPAGKRENDEKRQARRMTVFVPFFRDDQGLTQDLTALFRRWLIRTDQYKPLTKPEADKMAAEMAAQAEMIRTRYEEQVPKEEVPEEIEIATALVAEADQHLESAIRHGDRIDAILARINEVRAETLV